MTYLLACLLIGCVAITYLTVEQLIVWVPKILDWFFSRYEICKHGRRGHEGCWQCEYDAREAGKERRLAELKVELQGSATGAAEGGSTYQHNEDDWFDERRPAHPDRPDEDWPDERDPRPYG